MVHLFDCLAELHKMKCYQFIISACQLYHDFFSGDGIQLTNYKHTHTQMHAHLHSHTLTHTHTLSHSHRHTLTSQVFLPITFFSHIHFGCKCAHISSSPFLTSGLNVGSCVVLSLIMYREMCYQNVPFAC